jgi:hypothetical protein
MIGIEDHITKSMLLSIDENQGCHISMYRRNQLY